MGKLNPLGDAVAGAAAASFASTLVYPVDIATTKLQTRPRVPLGTSIIIPDEEIPKASIVSTLKDIVDKEGFTAMYRGLDSSLFGTIVTQFTYFYFYSVLRNPLARRFEQRGKQMSIFAELGVGMAAGAISRLFTTPISVVTTRQQVDGGDFWQVFKEILSEPDGWKGLYRGLRANLVLTINPSITYGVFERLKTILLRRKLYEMLSFVDVDQEGFTTLSDEYLGEEISVTTTPGDIMIDPLVSLSAWEIFIIGAISKSLATIATYPYILARVKLQSKNLSGEKPYSSAIDVLSRSYQTEGWQGWYKGMSAQLIKSVATQVILFLVKDKFEDGVVAFIRFWYYGRTRALARAMVQDGQVAGK